MSDTPAHPPAPRRPRRARLRQAARLLRRRLGPHPGRRGLRHLLPRRRGLARSSTSSGCARPTRSGSTSSPSAPRARPTSTRSPRNSLAGGVQLISRAGQAQTPGGGYGFRFFDIDGRTIEVSADVEVRQHRRIEEKRGHPGPALARGPELPRPERHPRVVRAAPRLPALRHAGHPHMGDIDALHADQQPAPQHGHRPAARTPPCTTSPSRCAASTSTCAAPAG